MNTANPVVETRIKVNSMCREHPFKITSKIVFQLLLCAKINLTKFCVTYMFVKIVTYYKYLYFWGQSYKQPEPSIIHQFERCKIKSLHYHI